MLLFAAPHLTDAVSTGNRAWVSGDMRWNLILPWMKMTIGFGLAMRGRSSAIRALVVVSVFGRFRVMFGFIISGILQEASATIQG